MARKKTRVAIIYDFDKTLATNDMQNFDFIPRVNLASADFWKKTGEFCSTHNADKILGYMFMMIQCAKDAGIPLTKKFLNECGKKVEFFQGVETWFDRINEYGKDRNTTIT